jgi:hypothetical protein
MEIGFAHSANHCFFVWVKRFLRLELSPILTAQYKVAGGNYDHIL